MHLSVIDMPFDLLNVKERKEGVKEIVDRYIDE